MITTVTAHDDQRRTRGTRREDAFLRFQRVLRCTSCLVALVSLTLSAGPEPLPQDKGAAGTWQRLLKLQTTASAMHTTAHPDDEHGGVLAQLSRGRGARVSLLTLNRGESGDNALGPELFDALGLIRTEELLMAGRYYGLDHQYFTTAIDYGFSKRLEEALVKWGRENVLRDVVRVIRMDRPLVLIARFQGNARDGHGNHETAGIITQEAYRSAGDPSRFPEQIREGLRPWQPLKLYMGGVREDEDWTLRTDTGEFSAWLGESYQTFSRIGLAFQRSQNGGRLIAQAGPSIAYYKRLASVVDAPARERSFFDGIDTSIPGLFSAIRRPAPPNAAALLAAIDGEVRAAVAAFSMQSPSACVPALARGLAATRAAIEALRAEPDAVFVLQVKEQQFMDAINTALGIDFEAIASAGPVVPGQQIDVRAALTNRGAPEIEPAGIALLAGAGWRIDAGQTLPSRLAFNETARQSFSVTVPETAPLTRPYFERESIAQARYTVRRDTTNNAAASAPEALRRASPELAAVETERRREPAEHAESGFSCAFCGFCVVRCDPTYRPAAEPALRARARYTVAGVPVEINATVRRREAHLPYGDELRELMVVPAVAVNVAPRVAVVPTADAGRKALDVRVELLNNLERGGGGQLALRLPAGWTSAPAAAPFTFARAGERSTFRFSVSVPALENRDYTVEAVATVAGRSYTEGYDVIEHRDLETRYLYHPAAMRVRGVDVRIAPGLKVGYVMGIGDEVPAGIAQLGASVTLLGEQDLASGDLRQYDAIMTGTRAYAVREDLKTYNRRLLDYAQQGGNLIVLYNTQEFVPDLYAPFPAQLPARAEEVSEEDSPVEILAPSHRSFTTPNRITQADFDGWVEQRGSKFFTEWDAAYTPMIATHDQGQAPQQGGWVTAAYGKGHYTYFAYAFHRQLPYGVPGAYRLLANLLSLSK
jgi:LmbE family N-acetylglucosaminyl deacetylase